MLSVSQLQVDKFFEQLQVIGGLPGLVLIPEDQLIGLLRVLWQSIDFSEELSGKPAVGCELRQL